MKVFLIPNPNPPYNLMIRYPGYRDGARPEGLTDDDVLQAAIERAKEIGDCPEGSPIYVVEDSELPPNHDFFDAWEWEE
jgi:hypothetical protein